MRDRASQRSQWMMALGLLVGVTASPGCEKERGPIFKELERPEGAPAPWQGEELYAEASGILWRQPGPGWTIGRGEAGTAVVYSLRSDGEGCEGRVEAEAAEEGDPRRHGEGLRRAWCVGECGLHHEEFALYNGKTAWRWEARRETGPGTAEMVRVSSLVHSKDGGRPWRVTVWAFGRGEDYVSRRRCLDAVTAALSLGPAEGEPPLP